jgi:MFS family permease
MGTQTAAAGAAPQAHASDGYVTGYGTKAYRSYVLVSLTVIYILNFIDRGLMSAVAPLLKADIKMSDTAWGLLTGFGFAFLYTIVGIPLARISETKNRVWIMAICLALWSLMTALCGLSRDVQIGSIVIGGFWILLTCRIGVGIGEAGCTPPANSLISDYYPPKRRSTALGFYAMGVTLGTMLASIVGAPLGQALGWRNAFLILGLPGIAVAVLFVMTVKDAPRGYTDAPGTLRRAKASFADTFGQIAGKPAFWWMAAGATIAAFCGYAIANFQSLYITRTFGINTGEAGLWVNGPAYAAGAVGTVITGWMVEKIGSRSMSSIAWVPAIGLLISVPFYIFAFTASGTSGLIWCAVGLSIGHFVKYGYLAAQYTIGQGVVSMQARATATAILLFIINFIGYGLGPLFAGFLSDFFYTGVTAASAYPELASLGTSICDAGVASVTRITQAAQKAGEVVSAEQLQTTLAALKVPLTPEQYAVCAPANEGATRNSMLTISSIYAVSGFCFFICMFYLKKDMVAK